MPMPTVYFLIAGSSRLKRYVVGVAGIPRSCFGQFAAPGFGFACSKLGSISCGSLGEILWPELPVGRTKLQESASVLLTAAALIRVLCPGASRIPTRRVDEFHVVTFLLASSMGRL